MLFRSTLPEESDITTENTSDETTAETDAINTTLNSQTNTVNPKESEEPAASDGITRREWMVIALSALIVVCVIAILIVNILSNRKRRKDSNEK